MNLQVLVATMHQTDHSLLEKMNIQSDAIIGNQCDRNEIEEFDYKGNRIKYLSFAERGVGLNRNNALMRADGDICLFADDDIVYFDNYNDIVLQQFKNNPDADVIIFNLIDDPPMKSNIVKKGRVRFWNYMRYGTPRIAIKRKSITKNGISFNLHFGGGAEYSVGEDSLFLAECLKKGLTIIAVPIIIAHLTSDRESTWFEGYTDKYFKDKGVVYSKISKKWAKLLCFQFAIRRRAMFHKEKSWFEAYRLMVEGVIEDRV
jgi:glycosyltransferase involved in cell wall biosynthesis